MTKRDLWFGGASKHDFFLHMIRPRLSKPLYIRTSRRAVHIGFKKMANIADHYDGTTIHYLRPEAGC